MSALGDRWREFADAEPGHRFEREYALNHGRAQAPWKRVLSIMLGIGIIVAGIIGLPAPGPGFLIIGIGAAVLGRESRTIARWLDRRELDVRRLASRVKRWWRGLGGRGRAAIVVVTVALAASAGVVAVRFILSR